MLAGLDEATRTQIQAGPRRRYARDEVLFHMGDPANGMHLLASGHVSVSVETPDGDTAVLTVLGPGAAFGELALLRDDATRTATIRALDPVETVLLNRDRFEQLRRGAADLDRFLLDILVGYTRRLEARLLEALYVPVDKRVLRQVVALGRTYGDGRNGTVIPLTQEFIAGASGSTRSTTNQVLRAAESDGIISIGRGRITVTDAARLIQRAR